MRPVGNWAGKIFLAVFWLSRVTHRWSSSYWSTLRPVTTCDPWPTPDIWPQSPPPIPIICYRKLRHYSVIVVSFKRCSSQNATFHLGCWQPALCVVSCKCAKMPSSIKISLTAFQLPTYPVDWFSNYFDSPAVSATSTQHMNNSTSMCQTMPTLSDSPQPGFSKRTWQRWTRTPGEHLLVKYRRELGWSALNHNISVSDCRTETLFYGV